MAIEDLATRLILFEDGELDHGEFVQLFQDLYDTGWINELHVGRYERTMIDLINAGLIDIQLGADLTSELPL